LLELVLPVVRADATAAETYHGPPRPELDCPISVFGGAEDPIVGRGDLAAWGEHTLSTCSVHVLPGHHFFLASAHGELLWPVDRAGRPPGGGDLDAHGVGVRLSRRPGRPPWFGSEFFGTHVSRGRTDSRPGAGSR
jgi:Thioesterase domain